MRVQFLLTIKLTAESRDELIIDFGAKYRAFREEIERGLATGRAIQFPPDMKVRWLLDSGQWAGVSSTPEIAPPAPVVTP